MPASAAPVVSFIPEGGQKARRWSAMDIEAWLKNLGLEQYGPAFRDNAIDAELLAKLAP